MDAKQLIRGNLARYLFLFLFFFLIPAKYLLWISHGKKQTSSSSFRQGPCVSDAEGNSANSPWRVNWHARSIVVFPPVTVGSMMKLTCAEKAILEFRKKTSKKQSGHALVRLLCDSMLPSRTSFFNFFVCQLELFVAAVYRISELKLRLVLGFNEL